VLAQLFVMSIVAARVEVRKRRVMRRERERD
jgi:hypothetical protein